jgi:hypothetical protein
MQFFLCFYTIFKEPQNQHGLSNFYVIFIFFQSEEKRKITKKCIPKEAIEHKTRKGDKKKNCSMTSPPPPVAFSQERRQKYVFHKKKKFSITEWR